MCCLFIEQLEMKGGVLEVFSFATTPSSITMSVFTAVHSGEHE